MIVLVVVFTTQTICKPFRQSICAACIYLPALTTETGTTSSAWLQLREDVTRYRYGDEQHLDESLGKIFMFNRVSLLPLL